MNSIRIALIVVTGAVIVCSCILAIVSDHRKRRWDSPWLHKVPLPSPLSVNWEKDEHRACEYANGIFVVDQNRFNAEWGVYLKVAGLYNYVGTWKAYGKAVAKNVEKRERERLAQIAGGALGR